MKEDFGSVYGIDKNSNNVWPLFIIGHKRSGSTHLGKMLNKHPKIFISNETDILWILYQKSIGKAFEKYPLDGPIGMNTCLKKFESIISRDLPSEEIFYDVLKSALNEGFIGNQPRIKNNVIYYGDQKPFQNADPKLVKFSNETLGRTWYIHLVRHPKDVIRSCMTFGKNNDGGWMWKGLSASEILERWVTVENWILEMKTQGTFPIIDVRYEDMVTQSGAVFDRIFEFLSIEQDQNILKEIEETTRANSRINTIQVEYTKPALEIMSRYNYIPK